MVWLGLCVLLVVLVIWLFLFGLVVDVRSSGAVVSTKTSEPGRIPISVLSLLEVVADDLRTLNNNLKSVSFHSHF